MDVKVPYYVVKANQDGTVRRYWQPSAKLLAAGWPAEALPSDEVAAITRARAINDQVEAWRAGTVAAPIGAAATAAAPALATKRAGTVAWLIADYKAGRYYEPLSEHTKYDYDLMLANIEAWAGDMLVRALNGPIIEAWYVALHATTPTYANRHVSVLRRLLNWGQKAGIITHNPAKNPGLVSEPLSGKIWPAAATTLMIEVADRLGEHGIGDAITLNNWVGQREGDLIRLTKNIYRNGTLHWMQSKTRAYVQLPVGMVAALAQRLEAARVRHEAAKVEATTLIVDDATGLAFTGDRFRKRFAMVREAAARERPTFDVDYLVAGRAPDAPDAMTVRLEELQFMHYRHTAVTTLCECEVDNNGIRAITGHSEKTIETIKARYAIMTGKMAEQAFAKRIAREAARGGGQ